MRLDSATSDEPAYIATGMIKLVDGRLDYFRDEPPLMNSLSALPLVIAGYRLPTIWNLQSNHWGVGKQWLWRSGLDGHRLLFLARLPTIALFVALIVTMYFFLVRTTGSVVAALIGAALTGFCPNLMAHGRLATVDLALTFFAFLATALFLMTIERGSSATSIGMGVAAACAILSKTSGNILGPYFLIVLIAALILRRDDRARIAKSFVIAVASAIVFAEVFILAEARTWNVFVPFREYAANIGAIHSWYAQGHVLPQFLLGRFSTSGFPQYYLVAFLLKTTIPALLLLGVAIAIGRSFTFFALLTFVALFLAIASVGHLDLGIRYVLPIYPFIYAAIAIGLGTMGSGRRTAVIVLVAWHIGESVAAYPTYISYFNEFIGSRARADEFLIDSNLDWGQDLRRLDGWCRDNQVQQITIHYFGGADVAYDVRAARPLLLRGPGFVRLPRGYFALSRHLYRVSFAPGVFPTNYDAYLKMNNARFVTTVGGSINVYAVE